MTFFQIFLFFFFLSECNTIPYMEALAAFDSPQRAGKEKKKHCDRHITGHDQRVEVGLLVLVGHAAEALLLFCRIAGFGGEVSCQSDVISVGGSGEERRRLSRQQGNHTAAQLAFVKGRVCKSFRPDL